MFTYKGVQSELELIKENRKDFQKIINFMFNSYNLDRLECSISLHDKSDPEYNLGNKEIRLCPSNGKLDYYQQLNYQFAHELTHAIQHHQKRSFDESEAVANSVWAMEKVLRSDYNARGRFNPERYDYDKAFELVDTGKLAEIWKTNS